MDESIVPAPSVPPVQPVLPAKPTPWFKIFLIIVGVLVVLGLFGNLYLLAKNQKPAAEVTPTPTPIAVTTTPDPTASWKTYTKNSKNFGSFSIKYPEDWLLVEKQTEDPKREQIITTISRDNYKIEINAFIDGWGPSGCNFDKTIKNQPQISDYDSYVDINNPSIELKRAVPPAKVENAVAWTICAKEGANNSFASAFPFSGTITYFTPPNFNETVIKEMDQILSTFKFLDQNQVDATANWKTYTDENTHVQFKYPPSWYAQKYADSTFSVFLEDKPFQIIKGTEFMTSINIGLNELQNTVTGQKFYVEKTLKEGVERFRELFDPKTVQITELTIDGKKATKLSGLLSPGMLEGEYFVNTLIQLDDKLLVATLTKKNYEDVYNQILSTFKFLP